MVSRPRSTTTGGSARRCLERGVDPVVTFHHFTSPRWFAAAWRLGGTRHGRALRPTSASAPRRDLGDVDAPGVHDQRAQRRSPPSATSSACFPPGEQDRDPRRACHRDLRRRPPSRRRGHPCGSARRACRPHAVDDRLPGRRRWRGKRSSEIRVPHGGRVPRRHGAATTSSACSWITAAGVGTAQEGTWAHPRRRPDDTLGDQPAAQRPRGHRRAAAAAGHHCGLPCLVTQRRHGRRATTPARSHYASKGPEAPPGGDRRRKRQRDPATTCAGASSTDCRSSRAS